MNAIALNSNNSIESSFSVPVFQGVLNDVDTSLVDARTLHKALQVGRRFATWITERIKEYGFIENQDFKAISQNREIGHGRGKKDYHLSLDMAKELAMIEKTEIGRMVRRYFIQCERIANKLTGRSTTADERTGLRDAVNAMVSKKVLLYPDVYKLVHQRFNVEHIDELTIEQVGEATEYIHRLLLDADKPKTTDLLITEYEVYEIAVAAGNIQRMALMFEHLEPALRVMDSRLYGKIRIYSTEYYARTSHLTKLINRLYPLVSNNRNNQLSTAIARLM